MEQMFLSTALEFKEINTFEPGAWINLVNPSQEESVKLSEQFNIDITDLRAPLDLEETSRIAVEDDYTLIIDYAHNAVALESILNTLRAYDPPRLISLFGCGGNRSKLRRYEMGEVSGKLADFTIITSDNPRFEEPQAIIDDILTGMKKTDGEYISIIDRREAISYAMHHAQPGDIVVLAGKGHETYQEIKGKKYHMSEEEIVQDVLDGKY